ncbi:AAA family ATPase [Paenibacillus sp. NPDC058071]|uniref:helix-turn-helix transcriptional regulator n=1 Tax=Paenibacillus sp. NPDC058071 TaxID=3346326 RepID=UPI0036D80786
MYCDDSIRKDRFTKPIRGAKLPGEVPLRHFGVFERSRLQLFLRIAIQLVERLGDWRAAAGVRRGITLDCFVIDPESLNIRFVDKNYDAVPAAEKWAYTAPERMARASAPSDERSDLYAIGVLLYELLTGRLPQPEDSRLQTRRLPFEVRSNRLDRLNPTMPPSVTRLVMRLLEKAPENRYGSADLLVRELSRCLTEGEPADGGSFSVPSEARISQGERIEMPDRLVGREKESHALRSAYLKAGLGSTETVFITGEQGAGKTALAEDALTQMANENAFVVRGTFDRSERELPYLPVIEAFRSAAARLLSGPESELKRFRTELAALQGDAVLADWLPELDVFAAGETKDDHFDVEYLRGRFRGTFRKFVQAFADSNRPLVLFFDDWQWADPASRSLLKWIATDPESSHLLLIFAYRDMGTDALSDECDFEPYWAMDAEARMLKLRPLSATDIEELLMESLECEQEQCEEAAVILHEKSGGNPLTLTLLLADNGADGEPWLIWNETELEWKCLAGPLSRLPVVRKLPVYLEKRLKQLPEELIELLFAASCLSSSFRPREAAAVAGYTVPKTQELIMLAVQRGWITPAGKSAEAEESCRFTHPSFRQAVYDLMDQERKQFTHFTFGREMLQRIGPDETGEPLLRAADHLANSAELISRAQERTDYSRMFLKAGDKALRAFAYDAALRFYNQAIACLPEGDPGIADRFIFSLTLKRARCEWLCGHEQEARSQLEGMLREAVPWKDRAAVYRALIELLLGSGKPSEALKRGLEALDEAGVRLPEKPNRIMAAVELKRVRKKLAGRIETLAGLPQADEETASAVEIVLSILPSAYNENCHLFSLLAAHSVSLILNRGTTPAAPVVMAVFGMQLGHALDDYGMAYRLGRLAVILADRGGSSQSRGLAYIVFAGTISPWVRHYREGDGHLNAAFNLMLDSGRYEHAGRAIGLKMDHLFAQGKLTEVVSGGRSFLNAAERLGIETASRNTGLYLQWAKRLQDPLMNSVTAGGDWLNEPSAGNAADAGQTGRMRFLFYTLKMQIYYFFGHYAAAASCAKQAEEYAAYASHSPYLPQHHAFAALSIAAAWDELSFTERRQMKKYSRKLLRWALKGPDNFLHYAMLVKAEEARLDGSYEKALELYNEAVRLSHDHECLQAEGLAYELAAKLYAGKGNGRIAGMYMIRAVECYERWGAFAKTADMRAKYTDWLPVGSGGSIDEAPAGGKHAAAAIASDFSLATVFSKEWLYGRLTLAMEAAGAEKAALLFEVDGNWMVDAVCGDKGCESRQLPLAECGEVNASVALHAAKLKRPLTLNDAYREGMFAGDRQAMKAGLRSVYCLPAVRQGSVKAMIYMEHNGMKGAFEAMKPEWLEQLLMQIEFARRLNDAFGNGAGSGQAWLLEEKETDETDKEIFRLMSMGKTNKEMAAKLGLTTGAVKAGVRRTLDRLSVQQRTTEPVHV